MDALSEEDLRDQITSMVFGVLLSQGGDPNEALKYLAVAEPQMPFPEGLELIRSARALAEERANASL